MLQKKISAKSVLRSEIHTTIRPIQCIFNGEENPKIAPSLLDCVTTPEEDQAMAIGNMHKKLI